MTLPYCCVVAEFDGFTPEEHAPVCRDPRPAPPVQESPNATDQANDQGGRHL